MSEPQYDIIITGKLLPGTDAQAAMQQLASLFKLDPGKAAQLLDGKPHVIKKSVNDKTARQFRAAIIQTGCEVLARRCNDTTTTALSSHPPAAAPDSAVAASIQLAPEGTPVLKETERKLTEVTPVDTSGLTLAPQEALPSQRIDVPAIEPPDFGLAAAGEPIDTLPQEREVVAPDISHLSLDEPGVILVEPKVDTSTPPDTSHIKLEKQNPFL